MMPISILKQIPNALSLARIIAAPLFPFVPPGVERALFIFIIGGTDFFDGFLARRYNLTSKFGTLIDPIGDKLLVYVAGATFLYEGSLLPLEALALATRDLSIFIFFAVLKYRGLWRSFTIQSFWIGKVVTAAQCGILLLLALAVPIPSIFYWLVGLLGSASCVELFYRQKRRG